MTKAKNSEGYKREIAGQSKYKPEYCAKVIDHLSKTRSFVSFGGVVDVVEDTLYHWRELYPEFDEAVKIGRLKGMRAHEDKGAEGMDNPKFNAILWQMIGRRLYKYSEQREVRIKGLDKCKTYEQEIDSIMRHVAEGKITPTEGAQLAQIISTKAKTYETTEAKKILEEIKSTVNKGKSKK